MSFRRANDLSADTDVDDLCPVLEYFRDGFGLDRSLGIMLVSSNHHVTNLDGLDGTSSVGCEYGRALSKTGITPEDD